VLSRIWRIGLGLVLIVIGLTVVSHRRPSSGSMSGTMFPWIVYFVPGIWLVRAGLGGRFVTGRRPQG
jgi:hypothetical protein